METGPLEQTRESHDTCPFDEKGQVHLFHLVVHNDRKRSYILRYSAQSEGRPFFSGRMLKCQTYKTEGLPKPDENKLPTAKI